MNLEIHFYPIYGCALGIDYFDNDHDEALPFMYNTQIIELAESLLEKEKEQIADAWELGKCLDGFNGEEYYNRTFNTKEK